MTFHMLCRLQWLGFSRIGHLTVNVSSGRIGHLTVNVSSGRMSLRTAAMKTWPRSC